MKKLLNALMLLTLFLISSSIIFGAPSTCIDISIDRDGVLLQGKFYIADGTGPFATGLLLQGFPGDNKDVLGIGQKLAEAGINAMTFNYSGTHQSQGKFNFENTQKDIHAVFKFIHQPENIRKLKIDTTRIYLGGYSYGGGMALTYAANHPEIKRVISIAGNDHGAFIRAYNSNPNMKKAIDDMFTKLSPPTGNIRFAKGGIPKEVAEMKFIEKNPAFDLRKCANLLYDRDILLIGGWDDLNVSYENILLPLYRALKKENAKQIRMVSFHDTHSFTHSREKLAQTIIKWIKNSSKRMQQQ